MWDSDVELVPLWNEGSYGVQTLPLRSLDERALPGQSVCSPLLEPGTENS